MNIENLKPIPAYIAKRIRNKDIKSWQNGSVRFYAYFAKIKDELVKITVACKSYKNQWFCKQVAVHGVHSEICYVKDLEYTMMGYSVGWYSHGLTDKQKYYENGKWETAKDKYYDPDAEVVNKKFALKFDAYKYSVIGKYPYYNVFKYLRTYEQYPQAEYFIKLGLQHLATNKTLLRKAGKDKNFRKWLVKYAKQLCNECGNYPYFSAQVMLSAYKTEMTLLEAQKFDREKKELLENYSYTHTVSNVISSKEIGTFLNYIKKQNTNVNSYADYVKACTYLGLDMTLPKNRYPPPTTLNVGTIYGRTNTQRQKLLRTKKNAPSYINNSLWLHKNMKACSTNGKPILLCSYRTVRQTLSVKASSFHTV